MKKFSAVALSVMMLASTAQSHCNPLETVFNPLISIMKYVAHNETLNTVIGSTIFKIAAGLVAGLEFREHILPHLYRVNRQLPIHAEVSSHHHAVHVFGHRFEKHYDHQGHSHALTKASHSE